MRQVIWKYQVTKVGNTGEFSIEMPGGARLIYTAVQSGWLCVWAVVDPDKNFTQRKRIQIYETGKDMLTLEIFEHRRHLGLVILGDYVINVFEVATIRA